VNITMARRAGGLIGRVSSLIAGPAQPWTPDPPYPSIFDLGAQRRELAGKGGVYVLWHLGVRPRWLRAGHSIDLAASLAGLADLAPIMSCRPNGGVFVAWSVVNPDQRAGIVRYLAERLRPALQELAVAGESAAGEIPPVPYPLPPGTQDVAGAP
jgi:hypothetical protein